MAGGSGAPTAAPNPFGPQSTPMGGGSSPLNTDGGFSGGFGGGQTVGTMGGFGGDLGTAGTMGGFGGNLGTAGMGGQQMPSFSMPPNVTNKPPQSYDSYGFDTNVVNYLNKQRQDAARDAGVSYQYDPQTQMFTGSTMGGQVRKSLADIQREASGAQQPAPSDVVGHFGDAQYRPQQPPLMRNPFQPIEPSYMQDPEYQGYQTQARDLSRQMDEYMKKAPMYQQMQDLQNKMTPFQQRQEMQRMQQMQQRQQYNPYQQQQQPFNPYARQMPQQQMPFNKGMPYRQPAYDPNNMLAGEKNYYDRMAQQRQRQNPYQQQYQQQYQQPYGGGLQGLMEMLGGRRGMQQPSMSMGMPQAYYYKNGGEV